MMTTLRQFRTLRSAVVLALVVVATLGAVIWLRISKVEDAAAASQQQFSTPDRLAPMERTQRPTVLFVGDDFGAGYQGAYAYPQVMCDWYGLNCNVDAQPGTGFINNGRGYSMSNSRLIDRLPRDRRMYDANFVVIDAGRNDLTAGVEAYGQAMEQYLTEVRRFWPAAQIAVVAPSNLSADPPAYYAVLVSTIGHITDTFGGVLIDPVAEGWYDGVDVSTIQNPDHVHPNQAGHILIGRKLAESLQHHGLLHGLPELRATSQ
jgi:lysophospholipase L1-like esterase